MMYLMFLKMTIRLCGFAIGVVDTPEELPENLQPKEMPSARKSLSQI